MLPKRRQPTHPGVILEQEFLIPLDLSPKQCAEKLGKGWSELRVTALIQGKENVSEKTAQDLAALLGTTPDFWMRLEQQYSQWQETQRQNEKGSLKRWKKAQ